MSSKVFSGEAARTAPAIAWLQVPAEATPVWVSRTPALPPPAGGLREPGPVVLREISAAELERRVRDARQEGFREGEAAGTRRAGEQLEPVLNRLARTVEELAESRSRFRREAEQDLVRLAMAVARRILHREISLDPAVMAGVVRAALDQLDLRETHRLRVHPQEAAAIERRLREIGVPERLEVAPDAQLERGAAIFETARGEMDASLDTQLAEVSRGLADLLERRP